MCSAERSGRYFYTMCQTLMRREPQLSPPSMATARPNQVLLPSSSGTHGTTKAHRGSKSQCPIPAVLCWVRTVPLGTRGWRGAGTWQQLRRGPAWRGASAVTRRAARDTNLCYTCARSLLFGVFSAFSLLKGKKAQEVPGELWDAPPVLCVLSSNGPMRCHGAQGWGTARLLLPRCSST